MAWIMIDIFCWPSVIKFNYVAKAKRDVNSMWLVITHMGNSMYAYVYRTKERTKRCHIVGVIQYVYWSKLWNVLHSMLINDNYLPVFIFDRFCVQDTYSFTIYSC